MNEPNDRKSAEIELTCMVPCLNEEENVIDTIRTIVGAVNKVGCGYEILVIDDGSTDRTAPVVEDFIAENPDIPVVLHRNSRNLGLSRSFVDGAFLGRGRYYRLCCGDNVEPEESLVEIFSRIGQADIVAPYQPEVEGRPAGRVALSSTYTFLINLFSGHKMRYYNGCQVLRREDVMRWHSHHYGFGFQADMLTRMLDEGATVVEFPVKTRDRVKGSSKALNLRNVLSSGHVLSEILLRRIRRRVYPD